MEVHEKTEDSKEHLKPDLKPLWLLLIGVLGNETNATSHPNINSLKTAIEKEYNEMSEEFISKTDKSFRSRFDKIILK